MSGFRLEDAVKRALQHAAEVTYKKRRTLIQTLLEEDKMQEALWVLAMYRPTSHPWTAFFGSLAEELEELDDDTKLKLADHPLWNKLSAAFTVLDKRLTVRRVRTKRAGIHYLIAVDPKARPWALVETLSVRNDWTIALLALIKLYRLVKYGAVPPYTLEKLCRIIPALRWQYKDRPEILQLLDGIVRTHTKPPLCLPTRSGENLL